MPHGHPDYGISAPIKTEYALSDLGELAARLGSIDTFDRRGNVIFLDPFENTLNKWETTLVGTGASAALAADMARNGAYSLKLVTGNLTNNYAAITNRLAYPVISRLGLEFSSYLYGLYGHIYLLFELYDGTYRHSFGIRYTAVTNTWEYRSSNGSWLMFSGPPINLHYGALFHTFKLVIDPENNHYARFILNNIQTDISNYAGWLVSNPLTPRILTYICCTTLQDASHTIYLDDVIITQNEP